ncbi:MAG: SDR family NAD(P)-dependent oxidoreductase [Trueperaceae bacterium]|nr:MAG: SDR family NAD(P)-dependent oxidoreductase [Trueperaceae bacterium]
MFGYLRHYQMADLRDMLRNQRTPHRRTTAPFAGKTVVIAGATSGVGLAAAREVARFGGRVVLLARNEAKGRAVRAELERDFGADTALYLADFSRLTDVRRVARELLDGVDRIDVLINSAGVHSTRRIHTEDGFELTYCVNHLAPFLLTWRLIPRMRAAGAGRIVQVNSQGHRFGGLDLRDLAWRRRRYSGLRAYGASKTAQLLSVWELADRLEGSGVLINAMHPGEVRSGIGSNNGPLYRWYHRHVVERFLGDARASGEALHVLAAAPELEGVSGRYFNRTHLEKPAPHALDRDVGRTLWGLTMRAIDEA